MTAMVTREETQETGTRRGFQARLLAVCVIAQALLVGVSGLSVASALTYGVGSAHCEGGASLWGLLLNFPVVSAAVIAAACHVWLAMIFLRPGPAKGDTALCST